MKKLLLIFLAIATLLSLFACGASEGGDSLDHSSDSVISNEADASASESSDEPEASDISTNDASNDVSNDASNETGETSDGTSTPSDNSDESSEKPDDDNGSEALPPVIDPDYIEKPTNADIELFYDMIYTKCDPTVDYFKWVLVWPFNDDIKFSKGNNALKYAMEYYSFFGFKTDYLKGEQSCGDPLNRFVGPTDDINFMYVSATVYDVEALNWIAENVFNGVAVYPDDKNGYCHEGKYYDAYYARDGWGDPGSSVDGFEKSYKYLGNGQYRFSFCYKYTDESCVYNEIWMDFVAIPKYDEKIGTYWKLISYDRVKIESFEDSDW